MGIGIACTTVVIAVQQLYREFTMYKTNLNITDFRSAIWLIAISCAASMICFWRLHRADIWRFDSINKQKKRYIAQVEMLIAGVSCGVAFRIMGGMY